MGQVYVLKLRGGKWYVGYTERGITRVLEHLENKGKFKAAKWTQKHRPVSWPKAVAEITPDDHSEKDEDRITLALMAEHGIHNVRGGKWCMVNMKSQVVKELEKRIGKPKGGVKCGRCGRIGHNRTRCYASKTVDGVTITTKSWKFQPKAKAKPKPKPKKAKPKPKPKKAKPKPKPKNAKDKNVICARCNRVGHESKDCYASSKVAGTGVLADMLRRGLPKR